MRLDDIYRSDVRFDKMGAAQHISDWYDEIIDFSNNSRKQAVDKILAAAGITEVMSPDDLYTDILRLQDKDVSRLYRKIKGVMRHAS